MLRHRKHDGLPSFFSLSVLLVSVSVHPRGVVSILAEDGAIKAKTVHAPLVLLAPPSCVVGL